MSINRTPPANACKRHICINCGDCFGPEQNAMSFIRKERVRQREKWGDRSTHPSGSKGTPARQTIMELAQEKCRREAEKGTTTWKTIRDEECREADFETDPRKLYAELGQIAAVCVAQMEDIERKATGKARG